MLPAPLTYAKWLAAIRVFTGIFWLAHGVPKLLNPQFFGPSGMMAGMLREANSSSSGPYHDFIVHVVLPNASLFSHLVAWGETLTGVSLLLGLLTRVGGFFGVFLALNYFLLKGSFHLNDFGALEPAAMALSLINLVLPTGLVYGVEGAMWASRLGRRSAGET